MLVVFREEGRASKIYLLKRMKKKINKQAHQRFMFVQHNIGQAADKAKR